MNDELLTEFERIRRFSEGDAAAFGQLYDKYRGKVFSYAYTLSKSRETAEEIVQEVFLKLWQKRTSIDAERNFEAYLRKVTLNHLLNFFKKAARHKALQEQIFRNMEMSRTGPEEELMEKELQRAYREAVEKLPPQKKVIYRLSRQEELTHEQIARALNLSRNTVNNHLVEALKFIRNYIRAHGGLVHLLAALLLGLPPGK